MRKRISIPASWMLAAGALAVGEALGLWGARWAAFWPLAAIAAVMVALYGFGCAWRGWGSVAWVLLGLTLALRFERGRSQLLLAAENARGPFVLELALHDEPRRRGDWVAFVSSAAGVAIEVIMPARDGATPRLGERWRVAGWLERKPRSDRRRRTLWVKGRGTSAKRVGELHCAWAYRLAGRFRRRLSRAVAVGLGDGHLATRLHRAMLLGERAGLPRAEKANFIAAGTMHVFAISGLHVGVVAMVMVMLLMVMLVPLRLAGALMVPLLWGYVLLIGLPPSAVRAGLMASCYFMAPAVWQRSNGLVAWSQAFVIVHVFNPGALTSVGSLLSFAVMFAILAYDRWASAMMLAGAVRSLGLVFAIWAAGVPIAATVFGRVSLGGLLANFAVVPLAAISVGCGFLGALISLWCPFLGAHCNNAAALVTDAMRGISAAVAAIPGSNFETEAWSWGQCALWYASLLLGAATLLWLRRNLTSLGRAGVRFACSGKSGPNML